MAPGALSSSRLFSPRFLDELLQQRAGEPFGEADSSLEEVAAVAACLLRPLSLLKLAAKPALAAATVPSHRLGT